MTVTVFFASYFARPLALFRHRLFASIAGQDQGYWCADLHKLPASVGHGSLVLAGFEAGFSVCPCCRRRQSSRSRRARRFYPASPGTVSLLVSTSLGANRSVCCAACSRLLSSPSTTSAALFLPSHAQTVQQRYAVCQCDELQFAAAVGLEGLFYCWAGAPIGGEGIMGINPSVSAWRAPMRRTAAANRAGIFLTTLHS